MSDAQVKALYKLVSFTPQDAALRQLDSFVEQPLWPTPHSAPY